MKTNNGVSLIILVITIIVIIIISGAVILSLANNNPIAQATEAVFKQNVDAYSSEISMYLSSQYASTAGAYNPEFLSADASSATYNGAVISGVSNIYGIVKSLDPVGTDGNKFVIRKGKLVYTGTDSNVSKWVEEAYLENLYIPKLTVTANAAQNKVRLDWSMSDTAQPYTYKIYQQKEGDVSFQSISTSNLKNNVKVLNVYPNAGTSQTFTNWKGQSVTLPVAASLKKWMEEPNVNDPKGYGKGLVDVDAVDINVFNTNPSSYLKDVNGNYKYDAIYFGHWDCNGGLILNDTAVNEVEQYIKSGRGVLAGHDTIGYNWGTTKGLSKLRAYFNIKVGYWSVPANGVDEGYNYFGGVAGSVMNLSKKGLLSTYPWDLGALNSKFNVPTTHSTSNFAYGDVWFTIDGAPYTGSNIPAGLMVPANFYLTTWNNTAMIQTGHSNGAATADEQKIIANTLFYLSQLTSDTFLDDNSGQDVKVPTAPVITAATINGGTGKVDITFTASTDQGSSYNYYVEALGQNNAVVTRTSTKSTTVTSGIAGYSVVVDTSPSTIPASTVNTTTLTTSITKPAGTDIYVHIKAIDNKGNVSNTVHLKAS